MLAKHSDAEVDPWNVLFTVRTTRASKDILQFRTGAGKLSTSRLLGMA